AADVVALRGDEPPLIVELKLGFSLTLFHQGIARLALTDHVYLGVARPQGRRALADNLALCRRLGLGLLTVREDGRVEPQVDPGPYAPRKNKKKAARLLREYERLDGDPNAGGATRHGIVTGYRQDALKCAAYLATSGAEKGAIIAKATGVKAATTIMRNNHYGWFKKVETGVYALAPAGAQGLKDWGDALEFVEKG
ncbi:MAG: DUF2161 domain-containing phosphodiesterase, partial [Pseudomonadota bacterium]